MASMNYFLNILCPDDVHDISKETGLEMSFYINIEIMGISLFFPPKIY